MGWIKMPKNYTKKQSGGSVFYFSSDKKTAIEIGQDKDEKKWFVAVLRKPKYYEGIEGDSILWGEKYALTNIGEDFAERKKAIAWTKDWMKKHPKGL